jgi:hypothetical protein
MSYTFNIDKLRLSTGRTIADCKKDANKLKKKHKINGENLHHSKALDIIAKENGISSSWHEYIDFANKHLNEDGLSFSTKKDRDMYGEYKEAFLSDLLNKDDPNKDLFDAYLSGGLVVEKKDFLLIDYFGMNPNGLAIFNQSRDKDSLQKLWPNANIEIINGKFNILRNKIIIVRSENGSQLVFGYTEKELKLK